jgi:hypothetical protein
MLPPHVIRSILVAVSVYGTSVYYLQMKGSDAILLAAVGVAALFVADHYSYYNWMKHKLYSGEEDYSPQKTHHPPHPAPVGNGVPYQIPHGYGNGSGAHPPINQTTMAQMANMPGIPTSNMPYQNNFGYENGGGENNIENQNPMAKLYQLRDSTI